MKFVLALILAVASALPDPERGSFRPVNTYFDLIHSGLDWRPCCNTSFHSDEQIAKERIDSRACYRLFHDDVNCFSTCFYNAESILYDPFNGFNVDAIKSRQGSAAYTENDWKTENADGVIDDCIAELPVNKGVFGCNPNVRTFANCYWNKMFQLCPADIRNDTNCLY